MSRCYRFTRPMNYRGVWSRFQRVCTVSRANISLVTYHLFDLDHKSVIAVHLPDHCHMISDGLKLKYTYTQSHQDNLFYQSIFKSPIKFKFGYLDIV